MLSPAHVCVAIELARRSDVRRCDNGQTRAVRVLIRSRRAYQNAHVEMSSCWVGEPRGWLAKPDARALARFVI